MRILILPLAAALLVACAATSPEAASGNTPVAPDTTATPVDMFTGTHWKLVEADGGGALQEHATTSGVTMAFAGGSVSGGDGCNRYSGSYAVRDDTLHIGPVAGTKMYCAGAASEVETAFLTWLQQPLKRLIDTADLRLRGEKDGRTLVFVADAVEAFDQ